MKNEVDAKNHIVADILMEAITQVHGQLRPFIIIFPEETGRVGSVTNITSVEVVAGVLESYLESLDGVDEMEVMDEEALVN
jgi:hypothetical protein